MNVSFYPSKSIKHLCFMVLLRIQFTNTAASNDSNPIMAMFLSCRTEMKLPCSMGGINYEYHKTIHKEQFRHIDISKPIDGKQYAFKFCRLDIGSMFNEHVENEIVITNLIHSKSPNNSIKICNSEVLRPHQYLSAIGSIMVMEYYPFGNVRNVHKLENHHYLQLKQYNDYHVIKFLIEMGLNVLYKMWKLGYIDRDFKAANTLITGDLSHPSTTTYIKIDYGSTISIDNAIKELSTSHGRSNGFCHWGSNVSPIDWRILYGLGTNKNELEIHKRVRSIVQEQAANQLMKNLESNDIIDLCVAAIKYRVKLKDDDMMGFNRLMPYQEHSESERRRNNVDTLNILKQYYDEPLYNDPCIGPKTVKELLIKVMWLSYYQLPGYRDDIDAAAYLNWNVFERWLVAVEKHQAEMKELKRKELESLKESLSSPILELDQESLIETIISYQ